MGHTIGRACPISVVRPVRRPPVAARRLGADRRDRAAARRRGRRAAGRPHRRLPDGARGLARAGRAAGPAGLRRDGAGPGPAGRGAQPHLPHRRPALGRHLARGRRRARRRPGLARADRRGDGLPRLRPAGAGHVDRPAGQRRAGAVAGRRGAGQPAVPLPLRRAGRPRWRADLWDLEGLAAAYRRVPRRGAGAHRRPGGRPDARARLRRPQPAGPRVAQVPVPRPGAARGGAPAGLARPRGREVLRRDRRVAAAAGPRVRGQLPSTDLKTRS